MNAPVVAADDSVWREIADGIPVSAWIADRAGRLLWRNQHFGNVAGAGSPGDLWARMLAVDGRDEAMARWAAGTASGAPFTLPVGNPGDRCFSVRPVSAAADGTARWLAIEAVGEAQREAETARAATRAELDTLTNAMPQMVWATRPDGHHEYYNAQWYRFTGVPEGSTDGEGWNGMFHPDDQDRAWGRWRQSLATGEDYEIEYRLRHHSGRYRWVLGRALPVRGPDGAILRWIGTCTDIDAAKRAAERNDILSRELSHRIKNIFAIISGLIRMSARRYPAMRDFADDLARRIAALGTAHDLARPHSDLSRPLIGDATLHHVLRQLLSPYQVQQWRVEGDDVPIDDRGATPVALIFHELATNAAKYGALSNPAGQVSIRTVRAGDELVIEWRETGGPAVAGAPTETGFGTRLAALSIEQQLAGTIDRDWRPEGLFVRIAVRSDALVRDGAAG